MACAVTISMGLLLCSTCYSTQAGRTHYSAVTNWSEVVSRSLNCLLYRERSGLEVVFPVEFPRLLQSSNQNGIGTGLLLLCLPLSPWFPLLLSISAEHGFHP